MEARREREFLVLDFAEALRLAESGTVEAVQDHTRSGWLDMHVWYDNHLFVRYGTNYAPVSVQLCGTDAVIYAPCEEVPDGNHGEPSTA